MTTTTVSTTTTLEKKFSTVLDILSLTKPRLSSLVIFTCALGLFLAPGEIDFNTALITILATSGLVGGGCAINCYMERDIDALMERTKNRALPSGRLQPETALVFGLVLIVITLSALYFAVNPLTAFLGFTAAMIYLFLYTPMKKISSLALFAGAIPGAIPPLMGWTSVTNSFGTLGWILFAILFIWQLPHFLSISIYHARDYNNADLKVLPANIGIKRTVHRIALYTFIMLFISLLPYWVGAANEIYRNLILLIGGAFFAYSLVGYKCEVNSPEMLVWARRYFYGSLMYLPCVFVLMIMCR